LPTGENAEGVSVGSTDPTDRIVGEFAGAPTTDPELLEPAIINNPLLNAACPAAV
jgi:hypothetical protein